MYELFLSLHLLAAVFAIGPLAHAATTAARGLRTGDGAATTAAARTVTIYSFASVLVVVLGFGVMSSKEGGEKVADIGDPYIWISALLWLAAVALALGVLAPTLTRATEKIGAGETVSSMTGKVAATGGVIGLVFAVIIFLMVYKPGS